MKLTIALVVGLVNFSAHADVTCVINGENPNEANSYDQLIYQGDIGPDHPVAIRPDRSLLTGDDLRAEMVKLMTDVAMKNNVEVTKVREGLEGATFVIGLAQEDRTYSIGVGHFDFSKPEAQLTTDVVVVGGLNAPLFVIESRQKIAISCSEKPADAPKPE